MNTTDSARPLIGHNIVILSSDWLELAGAGPLMITTLMTFLRSLNNEDQEERCRVARQVETDHPRAGAAEGKWYPGPGMTRTSKEENVQTADCLSVFVFS